MQRLIDKKKEKTREEIVKCVNGERYTKTKRVKEKDITEIKKDLQGKIPEKIKLALDFRELNAKMDTRDKMKFTEIGRKRLNTRNLIVQSNRNPYLNKSNYLEDIKNEDMFLRGKNNYIE